MSLMNVCRADSLFGWLLALVQVARILCTMRATGMVSRFELIHSEITRESG